MKNKLFKIILIIATLILLFCNSKVYAVNHDPTTNPDFWKPEDIGSESELVEKAGAILGLVNTIGVICSVIALLIIGFKYMIGSVEEKAEYKQAMMPYIIGSVLVFATTTLPNVIFNLTKGLFA